MELTSGFDSSGMRIIEHTATDDVIDNLRNEWQSFVKHEILPCPEHFSGKGIVMCAGGLRYFTCSWVSIHLLRYNDCRLPIEVWYKTGELNREVIDELKQLDVVCRNIDQYTSAPVHGYAMKPFAIMNSSFKEVLFVDADNNCVTDPTYLFGQDNYKRTGVVFWPDFWKTEQTNPIWRIVDAEDYEEYEQESGQILIDKERCWEALNLCWYFNRKKDTYYKFLMGDKDTFKFAWKALKQPYHMIPTPVGYCGYAPVCNELFSRGIAMVQHDGDGKIIFIHQNMAKWDVAKEEEHLWSKIKRFKAGSLTRVFVQQTIVMPNGEQGIGFDIEGDVLVDDCKGELHEMEKYCLQVLKKLRCSDFYHRFILYLYLSRYRREV